MRDEIIRLQNLYFKYDKDFVLSDINLSVNEGDFVVFIGPNGGGKSTLAKLILGLLEPYSGKIIYPNEALFNKQSLIGYTPQDTSINKDFPIQTIDVVLMGFLEQKRFGYKVTKRDKFAALEVMKTLGIEHLEHRKIGELSGGQRQRVMIARALCGNPKLLIFDEPTSNIDLATQKEIYSLLKQINLNHTIILISHDISVLDFSNKVFFINNTLKKCDKLEVKAGS